MLQLSKEYNTTHLSTRSLAERVHEDLSKLSAPEQVLDFEGIEFASRSFMVQIYSMLAKENSQARFINLNDTVEQMLELAIRAWNRPATLPPDTPEKDLPKVIEI